MKKLITIVLLFVGLTSSAQTWQNYVGAMQRKIVSGDTLYRFNGSSGTFALSDTLLQKYLRLTGGTLSGNLVTNSNLEFNKGVNNSGLLIDAVSNTYSEIQAFQAGVSFAHPLILQRQGGSVGIQTATPTELLDVNGNVKATAFKKTSGTSSEFLKADGSSDSNTYLTAAGAVTSITGTSNQVISSASTGAVTLSLPQSIATTSTPQFAMLGLGTAASASTSLIFPASTTSVSSFRLPSGVAPSSPTAGDVWSNGTSILFRSGGTTTTIANTANTLSIGSSLNSSQGSGNTNLNGSYAITRAAAANTAEFDTGLVLQAATPNTPTGASSGNQIYSPPVVQAGSGWKTTATAASQRVEFRHYVVPVQGTTNPTGYLNFDYRVNNTGSYNNTFRIYSDGRIKLTGFTVATLPSSANAGDEAYVTDAVLPTYLGLLTGGGSVVTPVFYDGTNWVSH